MSRMTYIERAERFDADLAAAVAAEDSERQLVSLLNRTGLDSYERSSTVAALGESGSGSEGSAVVRAEFADAMSRLATATKSTRAQWRDLACTAVIALANRDGPIATDVYLAAAESANPWLRDYGMTTLAPAGDDRGWDLIATRLAEHLRRKLTVSRCSEVLLSVEYLARYASVNSVRASTLVSLIREHWVGLARPPLRTFTRAVGSTTAQSTTTIQAMIRERWPGIEPGGLPADVIDLPALHTPTTWWQRDI